MTKAEDLIYNHVFKTLVNDGYQQAHSEQGGGSSRENVSA